VLFLFFSGGMLFNASNLTLFTFYSDSFYCFASQTQLGVFD